MVDFIVILYGINTILVGFCLHELHKIRRLKEGVADETVETPDVTVPVADEPELYTEEEVARLERETNFDVRIARIKEELAKQMPDVTRKGSEAPILMAGVENLPHSIIRDNYDDLPDVEITQ